MDVFTIWFSFLLFLHNSSLVYPIFRLLAQLLSIAFILTSQCFRRRGRDYNKKATRHFMGKKPEECSDKSS